MGLPLFLCNWCSCLLDRLDFSSGRFRVKKHVIIGVACFLRLSKPRSGHKSECTLEQGFSEYNSDDRGSHFIALYQWSLRVRGNLRNCQSLQILFHTLYPPSLPLSLLLNTFSRNAVRPLSSDCKFLKCSPFFPVIFPCNIHYSWNVLLKPGNVVLFVARRFIHWSPNPRQLHQATILSSCDFRTKPVLNGNSSKSTKLYTLSFLWVVFCFWFLIHPLLLWIDNTSGEGECLGKGAT